MKKIILLGFLLAGVFSFSFAQQADVSKVLKFTNDSYDFGTITSGNPVKYQITITNIGSETVTIDNIQVGCHCTKPEYTQGEKIAPGAAINITLGFDAGVIGPFTRTATLYFNGGALSKSVVFRGKCVAATSVAPPSTTNQQ